MARPSQLGFLFGGGDSSPPTAVSSNAYASGSNQNAGNSITDRSTTRIHAPPGGRSSLNLFGGAQPAAAVAAAAVGPPPTASVATAVPAAPVAAPVASVPSALAASVPDGFRGTSSNAFASGSNQNSGNVITDRSSTRIHAPPGGRSSLNLFGGGGGSALSPVAAGAAPAVRAAAPALAAAAAAPAVAAAVPAGSGPVSTSSNVYASGSNQNSGNVLTDRPSTRVRRPPGGKSSFTIG